MPQNSSRGSGREQTTPEAKPATPPGRGRRSALRGGGAAATSVRAWEAGALLRTTPTGVRHARALALYWRIGGRLVLVPSTYRELAQSGLSRADVDRAVDDLVDDELVEVTVSAGRVVVRPCEAPT